MSVLNNHSTTYQVLILRKLSSFVFLMVSLAFARIKSPTHVYFAHSEVPQGFNLGPSLLTHMQQLITMYMY